MTESNMKEVYCFLCLCKQIPGKIFTNSQVTLCPGSQQSLQVVIESLAKSAQLDMQLSKNSLLCLECCKKVINFDEQKRDLLDNMRNSIAQTKSDTNADGRICKLETIMDPLLEDKIQNGVDNEDIKPNPLELDNCEESIQDYDLLMESKDTELFGFDTDVEEETSYIEENIGKTKRVATTITEFQCTICELNFSNEKDCDSHIETMHKIEFKFKCDICSFTHIDENYLMLHKNTHKGLTTKHCPWCHKYFKKRTHCIHHMELHIDKQKYQCDKCGVGFTTFTSFKTHKLAHDAEENPLFCDVCNKQFKTIVTYKRHAITHSKDRPLYTCEYCEKVFKDKYTSQLHSKKHFQEAKVKVKRKYIRKIKNISCIICSELFINQEQLALHMKSNHDVIVDDVVKKS